MGIEFAYGIHELRLDLDHSVAQVLCRSVQRSHNRPKTSRVGRISQTQPHLEAEVLQLNGTYQILEQPVYPLSERSLPEDS